MCGRGDAAIKPHLGGDFSFNTQDTCMPEYEDLTQCGCDSSAAYEWAVPKGLQIPVEQHYQSSIAYFQNEPDADYIEEPADMIPELEGDAFAQGEDSMAHFGIFPETCGDNLGSVAVAAPVAASAVAAPFLAPSALMSFLITSVLIHVGLVPVFYHSMKMKGEKEEEYIELVSVEVSPHEEELIVAEVDEDVAAVEEPAMEKVDDEDKKTKKPEKKKEKEKIEEIEVVELEPEAEVEEPEPEEEEELETLENMTPIDVNKHYVNIKNNESDKSPNDPKYFAPINSIVDEETRAENTNLDIDDGESTPPQESTPLDGLKPGDSLEDVLAHEIEQDDDPLKEKGITNNDEVETDLPKTEVVALPSKEGEEGIPADGFESQGSGETELDETGSSEEPEPEVLEEQVPEAEPIKLTPDNAPPLKIAISEDGEIFDPHSGEPIKSMKEIYLEKKKNKMLVLDEPGSGDVGFGPGADVYLSQKQMEGAMGVQWEEEKKAFQIAKESKTKGGFTDNIDKVMSQLENFIPDVNPGNQTALNAAYHPFAEWLTKFHLKLHPQWGDGYLAALSKKPASHPHNDMSLNCKLEIAVKSDGTIKKVTVVKASGNTSFDVAAINSVYGGQPYQIPPDVIKSYDGNVYLRWSFRRDHDQCGVWLSEPYIIDEPGHKQIEMDEAEFSGTTGGAPYSGKAGSGNEGEAPEPDIHLSHKLIDDMLGEQLELMGEAYDEAKETKAKLNSTEQIDKVMDQFDNLVPDVKPSNQTVLGEAFEPFTKWLKSFHYKLHPHWGGGYIAQLHDENNPLHDPYQESIKKDMTGNPHHDLSLKTKLEIVIAPDGEVKKITVVKGSGVLSFDAAAINAVYEGEPYMTPPEIIKSYDGNVYFRWEFMREPGKCGPLFSDAYIISGPGEKKSKVKKAPKEKAPSEPTEK